MIYSQKRAGGVNLSKNYDIAAYIWTAYTGDEPRARIFWKEGIGEWQSVKNAVKKFPEHSWPRKPLWGYVNEADPEVMEMEIDCAAKYGVNVFIYDWYWYDDRPFLENCLNDGYLKAKNNHLVKFYIMWANHDANNLWNIDLSDDFGDVVIWKGAVGFDSFKVIVKRLIEKYFTHPSYYKIDGKPVFMIYDFKNFVSGLGGSEGAKRGIEYFRNEAKKAGFPDLHLQLAAWGKHNLNHSGVDSNGGADSCDYKDLGFDSITNYQFVHFTVPNRPYPQILEDVKREYERIDRTYDIPYFPHVSIGWDNNPRYKRLRKDIITENTPENFEKALRMAKDYADTHDLPAKLITINSWNEWTETSYLQPDDLYGYGYLKAIKKVFKDE